MLTRYWLQLAAIGLAATGIVLLVYFGLFASRSPGADVRPTATPASPGATGVSSGPGSLTPAPSSLGSPDPSLTDPPIASPTPRPSGDIDSQAYYLEATIDFDARTLDVVETLHWTNTAATPARHIDLSVIAVTSDSFALTGPIEVDGSVADSAFAEHPTNLRVTFAQPIQTGQTATIVIPFELRVAARAQPPTGWNSADSYLVAFDDMFQFAHWFPIWSTPRPYHEIGDPQVSFNADWITLDLTSARDLGVDAVAGTGVVQPGATGTHWQFQAENVRDFAFIVAPGYELATSTIECDDLPIELRAYVTDGDAANVLRYTAQAFERFNDWFGCYAYPTFTVAQAPGRKFSMEFPGLAMMSSSAIATPQIVHHEVAHQWWYAVVGNDQTVEPWLDEAFAEYSSRLLSKDPIDYCAQAGDVGGSVFDFDVWVPCAYYDAIYFKGAALLDDLRNELGNHEFFAALREIVETYRFGMASTSGVLAIFERHSSRPLDSLFERYGVSE